MFTKITSALNFIGQLINPLPAAPIVVNKPLFTDTEVAEWLHSTGRIPEIGYADYQLWFNALPDPSKAQFRILYKSNMPFHA